jgi:hypothetical protein
VRRSPARDLNENYLRENAQFATLAARETWKVVKRAFAVVEKGGQTGPRGE